MWLQDNASMDVLALRGYKMSGARLVLTVVLNTLVSGKGVVRTVSTFGSNTIPTLRTVALGGRVGLIMVCRSQMDFLW
jgi:hypothetical protein